MLPVKALEARFSCESNERRLQEEGRVPTSLLLGRLRIVSCVSVDQETGREPLKEQPMN
jgi:hypothetical protein